jgi:hypothetical protein
MEINMQTTVKAIFNEWSQALKIENLKADLSKVASDLTKIKDSIVPQTGKTLAQAEKKYKEIVNKISLAQKQWNSEAKKAAVLLKKTSKEVETTLVQYKKIADKQKTDLKKSFVTPVVAHAKNKLIVKKTANITANLKSAKSVGVKAKNVVKTNSAAKTKKLIKAESTAKTKVKAKAAGAVKAKHVRTSAIPVVTAAN